MVKHHALKIIEISAVIIFVLAVAYFVTTGVLSTVGVDHAWPYPSK